MTAFDKALDDLATAIATKAAGTEVSLSESSEALKVLTAYYAAKKKESKSKGPADDPEDGTTMGDLANSVNGIEESTHGPAPRLRSRQRN